MLQWLNGALARRVADLEEAHGQIRSRLETVSTASRPPYDDRALQEAVQHLRDRLDTLTHAIAEGIERVDRSERRIRQVVTRARQKLADSGLADDALEAEAEQLQLLDAERSGGRGVQPVHAPVASAPAPDLSILPGAWGPDDVTVILKAKGMA